MLNEAVLLSENSLNHVISSIDRSKLDEKLARNTTFNSNLLLKTQKSINKWSILGMNETQVFRNRMLNMVSSKQSDNESLAFNQGAFRIEDG
jgi:NAD kinase